MDRFQKLMGKTRGHYGNLGIWTLKWRHLCMVPFRVKQWCQHTWKTQKSFDELAILEFLPIKMRTDMALDVHFKVWKSKKLRNIHQKLKLLHKPYLVKWSSKKGWGQKYGCPLDCKFAFHFGKFLYEKIFKISLPVWKILQCAFCKICQTGNEILNTFCTH